MGSLYFYYAATRLVWLFMKKSIKDYSIWACIVSQHRNKLIWDSIRRVVHCCFTLNPFGFQYRLQFSALSSMKKQGATSCDPCQNFVFWACLFHLCTVSCMLSNIECRLQAVLWRCRQRKHTLMQNESSFMTFQIHPRRVIVQKLIQPYF